MALKRIFSNGDKFQYKIKNLALLMEGQQQIISS